MAELGAVASVLQVAQFGAQLSLTLYNVAQTVKTASQDVKRVAKEIALFAQVLKDLGLALDRGQGSKLYRGDAYETSRMIVEECEGVFKEIEEILFRKTTKESRAFDAALSIPKAERFLWVFRKGRVQLLRSNLESLKSTISLKLALLAYADKHASSIERSDDADDVSSLKSLVLANETATGELRELTSSTEKEPEGSGSEHSWSPGPIATHGIWNLLPTGKQMGSSCKGDGLTPTTTPEPATSLVTPNFNTIPWSTQCNGEPMSPVYPSTELSTSATELRLSSSVSRKVSAKSSIENTARSQKSSKHLGRIWGNLDKLELAVKKLDIAIWELKRIEKNTKLGWPLEYAEKQSTLLIRLEDGLSRFGLSTEQIRWAMNRLVNPNIYLGQRNEISQTISRSDVDLTALQEHGLTFATAQGNHDLLVIQRWLPNYFEDILWSHIKQKIHDMQGLLAPEPVRYMPTLFEVTKTVGKSVHTCDDLGSKRLFTRPEHHRQHNLNHSLERYQCEDAGCQKSFQRSELRTRHMKRRHHNPKSQKDYRHGQALTDQHSSAKETLGFSASRRQLKSSMGQADPTTPRTINTKDLDDLNLDFESKSPKFSGSMSTTYQDEPVDPAAHSTSTMNSHGRSPAQTAGGPYLPSHDRQSPPSLPSNADPSSQRRPSLQPASTLPSREETGTSTKDSPHIKPSSKSTKFETGTAPVIRRPRNNGRRNKWKPRKHFPEANSPRSQPTQPTSSPQILCTDRSPPRESRQALSPGNAVRSASWQDTGERQRSLCLDAPSHRALKTNVAIENAEANEAVAEAPRVDPDQVVNNLLRRWSTLLDMPLEPSYGK